MGPNVVSEALGYLHRDANCGDQLCYLQRILPGDSTAESFVGHHHHIAGLECNVHRAAAEHSALSANHSSVRPDHENRFLVRHRGRATSLLQIPAGTLPRFESDSSGIVNRSIDHDKVRLLGNVDHIASPDLNISGCVSPPLHIARDVNDHATWGWCVLELL